MDASSIVIILSALSMVAAAPSARLQRAALFPIVECPDDDSPYPQVILLPSLGGVELASNQYVVCFQGVPQIFNCSEGLFFNWSTMSCDFPYERSIRPRTNDTSADGILDLIPAGPIPVPISPQYPIPFWPDRRLGVNYPVPPFPITRPNPAHLLPIPVSPLSPPRARPPSFIPHPPRSKIGEIYPFPVYPISKPNPGILPPIAILPARPPPLGPRPVPYE